MLKLDEDVHARLNAASPDWMSSARKRGMELVGKLSMPTSKEEVWRYVDLPFDLAELPLAEQPGSRLDDADEVGVVLGDLAADAAVTDGFVVAVGEQGDGLVRSLTRDPNDRLAARYGTGVAPDLDIFAATHHAFVRDAVAVYVPAGRHVDLPIYVDVQSTVEGTVSFPHVTVLVEANAEADLIVGYRSPDGRLLVVNPQIEVFVEDGARLRLSTFQRFGNQTYGIIHQRVVLGRDASVRLGEVGLGGKLGRLHLSLDLEGRGSSTEVVGLFFGEQDQTLDYRLFMNHRGANTTSDVFLKGAVEDRARSVFTGLVKIEKNAAKVSAFETNRNLVLSEGASAHSVPNLEILCDDVVCGHGSTVGPLEEEPLYYLMSRGLPEARAARLLVHGFFEEVLGRLPHAALRGPARLAVNRKFVEAQQEGRV